jgi:hypothetical protein
MDDSSCGIDRGLLGIIINMYPHTDNFKSWDKFVSMVFKIILVYQNFVVIVKITPSIHINNKTFDNI